MDFSIFELVLVPNISWNCQFWLLLSKFAKNGVSRLKEKVNTTTEFRIFKFLISLGTKFKLKLTSLMFRTKFA